MDDNPYRAPDCKRCPESTGKLSDLVLRRLCIGIGLGGLWFGSFGSPIAFRVDRGSAVTSVAELVTGVVCLFTGLAIKSSRRAPIWFALGLSALAVIHCGETMSRAISEHTFLAAVFWGLLTICFVVMTSLSAQSLWRISIRRFEISE